jgi:hypothetical protein
MNFRDWISYRLGSSLVSARPIALSGADDGAPEAVLMVLSLSCLPGDYFFLLRISCSLCVPLQYIVTTFRPASESFDVKSDKLVRKRYTFHSPHIGSNCEFRRGYI